MRELVKQKSNKNKNSNDSDFLSSEDDLDGKKKKNKKNVKKDKKKELEKNDDIINRLQSKFTMEDPDEELDAENRRGFTGLEFLKEKK